MKSSTNQSLEERVTLVAQMGKLPLYIDAMALSPDSSMVAVASIESGIQIWNLHTLTRQFELDVPEWAFQDATEYYDTAYFRKAVDILTRVLAWSSDGTLIAATLSAGEVGIWVREGMQLGTIPRHATSVAFVPQRDAVVLSTLKGQVEIWEVMPIRLVSIVRPAPDLLDGYEVSRCVVACSADGTQITHSYSMSNPDRFTLKVQAVVQIWQIAWQGEGCVSVLQRTVKGLSHFLSRIEYVSDRHEVLCSERAGPCWTVDTDTGTSAIYSHPTVHWSLLECRISPDGALMALAFRDGTVMIWHRGQQQEILRFQAHTIVREEPYTICGVAWLPDGKGLVTVGTDRVGSAQVRQGLIKVWSVKLE